MVNRNVSVSTRTVESGHVDCRFCGDPVVKYVRILFAVNSEDLTAVKICLDCANELKDGLVRETE